MVVLPRLQALAPLWGWLPAFRAVAETEHLPTAARLCGVGPSSLSRSLALLERAVARPLFERVGRSLRLNQAGRELLVAVRDAMRRIDDGVAAARGGELGGPLVVASSGAGTTALVAPALERLRADHPALVPSLVTRDAAAVPDELLRGTIDVAFQEQPARRTGLVVRAVGSVTRGVYCGRKHPWFRSGDVPAQELAEAAFVAPPAGPDGIAPDGWPPERARRVALVVDQVRVGLELCVAQPLLAVLPDVLAAGRRDALRRLDAIEIAPSPVYALHRRALGEHPSVAARLADLVSGSTGPATDPSSRP